MTISSKKKTSKKSIGIVSPVKPISSSFSILPKWRNNIAIASNNLLNFNKKIVRGVGEVIESAFIAPTREIIEIAIVGPVKWVLSEPEKEKEKEKGGSVEESRRVFRLEAELAKMSKRVLALEKAREEAEKRGQTIVGGGQPQFTPAAALAPPPPPPPPPMMMAAPPMAPRTGAAPPPPPPPPPAGFMAISRPITIPAKAAVVKETPKKPANEVVRVTLEDIQSVRLKSVSSTPLPEQKTGMTLRSAGRTPGAGVPTLEDIIGVRLRKRDQGGERSPGGTPLKPSRKRGSPAPGGQENSTDFIANALLKKFKNFPVNTPLPSQSEPSTPWSVAPRSPLASLLRN